MELELANEFFKTSVPEPAVKPRTNGGEGHMPFEPPLFSGDGRERRTQIVCTMGPACDSESAIEALIAAGMAIARLNFSHGTYAEHAALIGRIRAAAGRLKRPVIIMQDLQGPKIRTGTLAGGEAVTLQPGAAFTITTRAVAGNAQEVSTSYEALPGDLRRGDRLLLDDGLIELVVCGIDGRDVHTKVVHGGLLKERKGINLPGIDVNLPILTEKDRADLAFGIEQGIDWLAVSFVNRAEDIAEVKRALSALGPRAALVPVMAKIETQHGVENLPAILEAADGVMVARGDLGVEVAPEFVPPIQKWIIREANRRGKFVITATQMLQSMVDQPRPTRAEASDVANAVYDGTNAVMLSAETASGAHPVEAVRMMSRLVAAAEATYPTWGSPLPTPDPAAAFVESSPLSTYAAPDMLKVERGRSPFSMGDRGSWFRPGVRLLGG